MQIRELLENCSSTSSYFSFLSESQYKGRICLPLLANSTSFGELRCYGLTFSFIRLYQRTQTSYYSINSTGKLTITTLNDDFTDGLALVFRIRLMAILRGYSLSFRCFLKYVRSILNQSGNWITTEASSIVLQFQTNACKFELIGKTREPLITVTVG